jgi:hypothetical protein
VFMKRKRGPALAMSKSAMYEQERRGWTSEGSDRAAIIMEGRSRLLCKLHGMQQAIRLEADGRLFLACGCRRAEIHVGPMRRVKQTRESSLSLRLLSFLADRFSQRIMVSQISRQHYCIWRAEKSKDRITEVTTSLAVDFVFRMFY